MPKHIGLDLGTSNTRIVIKGKGIVLRTPTVVTVDKVNKIVTDHIVNGNPVIEYTVGAQE